MLQQEKEPDANPEAALLVSKRMQQGLAPPGTNLVVRGLTHQLNSVPAQQGHVTSSTTLEQIIRPKTEGPCSTRCSLAAVILTHLPMLPVSGTVLNSHN